MSLFDSIISETGQRFGLGNKAGNLLAALLGLMSDKSRGGLNGFLDLFRNADLGDLASSWVNTGSNTLLSDEQTESALGSSVISQMATQAGTDRSTATSALSYLIPNVIDRLTPDGVVPDESDFLSRIGSYLTGAGAAVAGGLGAATRDTVNTVDRTADRIGDNVRDAAHDVSTTTTRTVNRVDDTIDNNPNKSVLSWLLPLILLGLALLLGFWFCSRTPTPVTNTNVNVNTNRSNTNLNNTAKAVDSTFRIEAKDGKYIVSGVVPDQKTVDAIKADLDAQFGAGNVDYSGLKIDANVKPFAANWWGNFKSMLPNLKDWKNGTLAFAGGAITEAAGLPASALDKLKDMFRGWTLPSALGGTTTTTTTTTTETRTLTEVVVPPDTKLQAYPNGIEDQLIKFIQSDYKTATADSLKDKWFNFDDLNFKFGTAELVPESKRQLDNIVAILKAFPDVKIKIGGYTDKVGDDAKNLKLSDDRAKAVKAALEKAGVGAQVPEAEGYGEQFATLPETASDKEREADRKTSVRLLK